MDFVFSDEQQIMRDSVARFGAQNWPASDRRKIVAEGFGWVRRQWREMAELGWLGLAVPEEDGGMGCGPVEVMAVMEGFGRHLITAPYVSSCVLAPALLSGGGDAAADVLGRIVAGEAFAAAGLIEADGGYDVAHVSCRAERVGEGYRLTGAKAHVEDGADADHFIVSARTAGGAGERAGISLFLLPADAPGLRVRRLRSIDQHRHASLELDGVTAVSLVGAADTALPRIEAAVDHAVCAHLSEAAGSMEAAADATLEYLRTRQQFGVPIGTFQVLQHRMVDIAVACEEARAMTYQATLSLSRGPAERRRAVSAGKTRVSQLGIFACQQTVQLHGGVGFSDELIVSHHLRRQMMLELAHGSIDHHRSLFAAA